MKEQPIVEKLKKILNKTTTLWPLFMDGVQLP